MYVPLRLTLDPTRSLHHGVLRGYPYGGCWHKVGNGGSPRRTAPLTCGVSDWFPVTSNINFTVEKGSPGVNHDIRAN